MGESVFVYHRLNMLLELLKDGNEEVQTSIVHFFFSFEHHEREFLYGK